MTTAANVILGAAPTLANGVVDTFEGYGDNAALQGAYTFNNTTSSDLTLDTSAASEGKNGVSFAYDFSAKDYQGFGRAFTPAQDWSGFDQIQAHLVPDGSNQKLVLQFDAGGATFEAYPSLAVTTPLDLAIPFTDFQDKAGTHPAPTAEQLKTVSQFYVYLNKTDSYTGPGSIGLDDIHAGLSTTPPGPTVIAVPTSPVWTDTCGPNNNGSFSGYSNTEQYTWKVTDHSTLNGKVGITVTARPGYTFPDGARTRWTRTQDNTRCAASITATTTDQSCTTAGTPVPGSLTLAKTGIRSAYVYIGPKTGTKAGDLSALAPGQYLVIATAEDGSAFTTVPDGWKPSPTRDADGNVVKVSRVLTIAAAGC
ncbi:MAG: hypothetical protein L0H78_13515 [Humibacillus sp.]|nr:hypothetical protein [Humibacillus sp.]